MELTKRTRPYETCIRHNPDGTIGAHHVQITEYVEDGVVIPGASLGPALPLSVADGQGGLTLSEVMGEATVQALMQVEGISAQNKALASELAAAIKSRDEGEAKIKELQDRVEGLTRLLAEAQATATGEN